jgi:hypothetical protein
MVLEAGSPFTVAELRSITELAATDWAAHRGLVTTTDVGIVVPSRPAAGAGIGTTGHVAARGADNREVMRDILGLDDAAIDALVTNGILISS